MHILQNQEGKVSLLHAQIKQSLEKCMPDDHLQ